jgi:hypothetical protein
MNVYLQYQAVAAVAPNRSINGKIDIMADYKGA